VQVTSKRLGKPFLPCPNTNVYRLIPWKSIQRLLAINQRSAILERASVYPVATLSDATLDPSAVDELSRVFRIVGVDITVSACEKALLEAQVSPNEITHTVGVTCTDAGNPGYDHFVSQRLKLRPDVDRVLLHGVGCAGGLSALRVAAGLAAGATQRKRAARILIFACELCSLHLRCDLAHISRNDGEASIAHALFGDAAAAMVLCNDLGRTTQVRSIYELLDWTNMVLPGTSEHMSFLMDPLGQCSSFVDQ
jgi:type III polyketide synthase